MYICDLGGLKMSNIYDVNLLDMCADNFEEETALFSTAEEVLIYYINKYAKVNLREMSKMSNIPVEKLITDLEGAIFQDPKFFVNREYAFEDGWVICSEYLSGNIRKKLTLAREMNAKYRGVFEKNIAVLSMKIPESVLIDEIDPQPGATWIDEELYEEVIRRIFNFRNAPKVKLVENTGKWVIEIPKEDVNNIYNRLTYGIDGMTGIKIFEATMNGKIIKVYKDDPYSDRRILDEEKTLAAQEKQSKLTELFVNEIRNDKTLSAIVEEKYNEEYVSYASSTYDGNFLSYDDLEGDVKLYKHQKDTIARAVLSKSNMLVEHYVGTGKTNIMIVSAHKLHQAGLSKKNLIVLPNNILGEVINTHKKLYPKDKILTIYPKDFTPEHRNEILEKICHTGETYVAIYMAYSSFDMLIMSKRFWIKKFESQLEKIRDALKNTSDSREKSILKSEENKLIKNMAKKLTEYKELPWYSYDDLGIETIFIDEAHNYKNIDIDTKADNIVGLSKKGSSKCVECLEKVNFTNRAVFLTGTPLTNSLADLFVMQSYLQKDELEYHKIDNFDNWIATFGERVADFEVDVANNLRVMTRFRKFNNIRELCAMFSEVADFYMNSDDNQIPVPVYNNVMVSKSEALDEYIKELSERADAVHKGHISRTEDNFLKITVDGRKAPLDLRLVNKDVPIDCFVKETKISKCSDRIMELNKLHPDKCQIVFCDLGTPKSEFNVYDCLADYLVNKGLERNKIAFVHDATSEKERKLLFEKINRAEISVVIGSTIKLGVGVNVQENLIALHHLDVPWKPSDMTQREGRILRKGNTCKKVYIEKYIVEGTFDAYSWQLLQNKQNFIASFLSGTLPSNYADDIADVVLNYAEIKALAIGSPLIRKRVEVSNLLEREKISSRQRQKQLNTFVALVEKAPYRKKDMYRRIEVCKSDLEHYNHYKETIPNSERLAFGEELIEALKSNSMRSADRLFSEYQGFDVILPAFMRIDKPYIILKSKNGGKYEIDMDTEKAMGVSKKLDNALDGLKQRIKNFYISIEKLENDVKVAREEIEIGNSHIKNIEDLQTELKEIDARIEKGDDDETDRSKEYECTA